MRTSDAARRSFLTTIVLLLTAFIAAPVWSANEAPRPVAKASKAKSTRAPEVRSNAVVVVDERDGAILYSRKATVVAPIASITKLMAALVVRDAALPLDEVLQITKDDRDTEHGSGSRLTVGTRLTRGDLLHLSLMSSENRAAHALGRNYPGGLPAFVRAMNKKAKALGMKSARFADPSGLSSNNASSAADLVKLVVAAANDPVISEFSTSPSHVVKVGRHLVEFRNTNSLVNKPDWDISLQKTGYTLDAGQCLVMKTTLQGRPVVLVLMNSFGKLTRVADARRIRRWLEAQTDAAQVAASSS